MIAHNEISLWAFILKGEKMKKAFLQQIKVLGELVKENEDLTEQVKKLQCDLKKSVDSTTFWYNEIKKLKGDE